MKKDNTKNQETNKEPKVKAKAEVNVKDRVKPKKKHKVLKRVLLTILLIILIAGGVFFYHVQRNGGGLAGIVTTIIGEDASNIDKLDDLYVLCMGKSQALTDTIMVVKYSPKNQTASMLSIPRDTFVGSNEETATPYYKINAWYQENPQMTLNAVSELTGLNIKNYITVDTKAFRDIVNCIGGVWFDVPIDMDYEDYSQDLFIHLKAGYQLLNGEQAEGVVRFRHNSDWSSYPSEYGDNDLGRMRTQREFIKAVLSQTAKLENITKLGDMIDIATKEVETNMSWEDLKKYIPAIMQFNSENIRTEMMPGTPRMLNEYSFYVADKSETKELVKEMFLTEPDKKEENQVDENGNVIENTTASESTVEEPERNSQIRVRVINATGSSDKYDDAVDQLENAGYDIVSSKGEANITKKTTIISRSGYTKKANAIKSLLCVGTVVDGETSDTEDITIIIGLDY